MKVLFRAKDKNTDNYVIGYEYYNHIEDEYYITHYASGNNYKIDRSTRSINFEDMLDSQENKIFASLSKDGKGGDIVEGKCRDVNGDTITRLHKPLPYKGLVRFYKETLMSVMIETKDEIIEKTKGWSTPIYVNRGKALRWCDCRQDIKVIGIQE